MSEPSDTHDVRDSLDTATTTSQRDPKQTLNGHEVEAELLADWRVMFSSLHARFATGDFATGLALVDRIGAAAEGANHHPDLTLTYPRVDVRLTSHDVGGITQRDIDLARLISRYADQVGARAEPESVQALEIALDTPDLAAVKPFWAAVLGLAEGDDDVSDPTGALPSLWFQDAPGRTTNDEVEQRFHIDIRVPPEVAERRVNAALEAGGTLADNGHAPSFWVLADAQGNKACVCTWFGHAVSPDEEPQPDPDEGQGETEDADQEG